MQCGKYHMQIRSFPDSCLYELACPIPLSNTKCDDLITGIAHDMSNGQRRVGRPSGTSIYDNHVYCSHCREWIHKQAVNYDLSANMRCKKCGNILRFSARHETKKDIIHPQNRVSGACPCCGKSIASFWDYCSHCMCDLNANKKTI